MLRLAENECMELKETITYLEQELKKSKEQMNTLISKYDQAQDEIHHCHDQIARQAALSHSLNEEIDDLKKQVNDTTRKTSEDTMHEQMLKYQNDILLKNDEINKLKKKVIEKHDESVSTSITQEQNKVKYDAFQNEISNKNREIERLNKELQEMKEKIDEFTLKSKSEGIVLLEIEHLKEDNMRLVNLLKGTKEYKQFAEFIEDSGGAIRLSESANKQAEKCDPSEWVPKEVIIKKYKYFHNLMKFYVGI